MALNSCPRKKTVLSVAALGLVCLSVMAVLAGWPGSWRESPLLFALGGVGVGGCAFIAWLLVRTASCRNDARLAWCIIMVGLLAQLLALGITPSDDVHRYIIEGRQIAAGQNPYVISPAAPEAQALVADSVNVGLNHPELTAIYPPVALGLHAAIAAIKPTLASFQWASVLAYIGIIVVLWQALPAWGRARSEIVVVAWNPVLLLYGVGEAHDDIWMALVLLTGVWLASQQRWRSSIIVVSLAALLKPFAVLALPWLVWRRPWQWWLVPAGIAALCYLPFIGAGYGLIRSLLTFGGDMHFHGAMESVIRPMMTWIIGPEPWLQRAITGVLVLGLIGSCGAIVYMRSIRSAAAAQRNGEYWRAIPWAFVALMLWLPTMHPWYALVLVVLLPLAGSWSVALWTCMAPIYWLHGIGILSAGTWIEDGRVVAVAHIPAVVCGMYEWWQYRQRQVTAPGPNNFSEASV